MDIVGSEGLIQKYGVVMNGKKVLRIMKKYNLMAEYIRKAKIKHKNERIEYNVKFFLLKRTFVIKYYLKKGGSIFYGIKRAKV